MKKTILHDIHVALGAKMAPFGGFLMPIQYEGIIKEHFAARKKAVIFDTCHMGEIRIRGPNVVSELEHLLTCDISTIARGQCRYGLMCNEHGGAMDDLIVYRFADDDFLIVVNASTRESDLQWIVSHVSASAESLWDRTGKLDLQGPLAPRIMQGLMGKPIGNLRYFHFQHNTYRGNDVLISRTGYTGEIGFEFYGTNEQALMFWKDCLGAGVEPAGLGARDTLRLEMGMPLYGHELDAGRNVSESGLSRSISRTKAFIGSDSVVNPAVQKAALVGIELEGRRAARRGDAICDEAGREIGRVTSGSFSPSLEKAIAMGYVEKAKSAVGTRIAVQTARQPLGGIVTELPFYKQGTARQPMRRFLEERET